MTAVPDDYPEHILYTEKIRIRSDDMNYRNHLGHDTLIVILNSVRMRFFQSYGIDEADVDGFGLIITDLGVVYKSEVFVGDVLVIDVAMADVAQKGCSLLFRVYKENPSMPVAMVNVGICFFDYRDRKTVPLPARVKAINLFRNPD